VASLRRLAWLSAAKTKLSSYRKLGVALISGEENISWQTPRRIACARTARAHRPIAQLSRQRWRVNGSMVNGRRKQLAAAQHIAQQRRKRQADNGIWRWRNAPPRAAANRRAANTSAFRDNAMARKT